MLDDLFQFVKVLGAASLESFWTVDFA